MMRETSLSYSTKRSLQQGFTLLELVLVLFLIGLLASAGLLFTENIESQAKYEETQKRIALIKRAIVGDLTRTVNGGPEISGFVADVGRLPLCLAELIELGDEVSPGSGEFNSPCDENDTLNLKLWESDDSGVGAGWRGPYISVNADRDGVKRFRDGFGNGEDADVNFGWDWALRESLNGSDIDLAVAESAVKAKFIRIKSIGFDAINPDDDIPVENDNKFVIDKDWLHPNGGKDDAEVNLNFRIASALSNDILGLTVALSRPIDYESFVALPITKEIQLQLNDDLEDSKTVGLGSTIPMGSYNLKLTCAISGSSSETCEATPEDYIATFLPRGSMPHFRFHLSKPASSP